MTFSHAAFAVSLVNLLITAALAWDWWHGDG